MLKYTHLFVQDQYEIIKKFQYENLLSVIWECPF